MTAHQTEKSGLGDPIMLEKIDKLFACGVGEHVALPMVVVVGDQSSGKSSVLEGILGMPLPRDSGLCTRFATQIVFRRAAEEGIKVSIIPDGNASSDHRTQIEQWDTSKFTHLDPETFRRILDEVHNIMGVSRPGESSGQTFSNDVLRLEITGPDQEHLSVIDVPGIFKNTTEGVTTKADMSLVRNMVMGYMENPRSVMLTVIPANVDVATQEILELATDVDPNGDRTLGVLTKPDLVDKGAEDRIIDLLEGRSRKMKLGWHVVRNPGQQQLGDSALDRSQLELSFFQTETPWKNLEREKVGIESLRVRVREILSNLVGREFPKVKKEMAKKLALALKKREALGPERATTTAQAAYLTDLTTRFQRLVDLALSAKFGSDELFDKRSCLRIAPAVMSRSALFSDELSRWGREYSFVASEKVTPGVETLDLEPWPLSLQEKTQTKNDDSFKIRKEDGHDDLMEVLQCQENLPKTNPTGILDWIRHVYDTGRGFELGTFDSAILSTTFMKQTSKWTAISTGYISDIIILVHRFIETALDALCPETKLRNALSTVLMDDLLQRYKKAVDQVLFILLVERTETPMTLNHYFNDNLEKCRQDRILTMLSKVALNDSQYGPVVKLGDTVRNHPMSNTEHMIKDIHDILRSYYKVAQKRVVDNTMKYAADHFLINGPDTPLRLFSPRFVSGLSPEELESIAGEEPRVRRDRLRLHKEIDSLEEARRILARI